MTVTNASLESTAFESTGIEPTEIVDGKEVRERLRQMLVDSRSQCVGVAAPYIQTIASDLFAEALGQTAEQESTFNLQILVSLEVEDYVFGSSDPFAIDEILRLCAESSRQTVSLRHLPRLHAKVFVCDWCGIVGSANLTRSGLEGRNFEVAAIVKREVEIDAVRRHFDGLWEQARAVTPELWDVRKKQIAKLRKLYGKEIKRIRDGIRNERVALERMPSDNKQADYYSELLDCLSWINDGKAGMRTSSNLIQHLRHTSDGGQISSHLAERRIAFMSEVGLIEQSGQRWKVTILGLDLEDDNNSRWWLFARLLRWCEERGDEQFRVLLQAIEKGINKATQEISLAKWRTKISRSDRNGWWEGSSSNESTAYDRFCGNSCRARNWLVSLGVLHREARGEFFYSRGELYSQLTPRGLRQQPFDARLNEVIKKASA